MSDDDFFLVREPVKIGQGWLDMDSAPTDGSSVWLTDGQRVCRAAWVADVHGRQGWRDDESFAHFRTFAPLGWQRYYKPAPPGWPREPKP